MSRGGRAAGGTVGQAGMNVAGGATGSGGTMAGMAGLPGGSSGALGGGGGMPAGAGGMPAGSGGGGGQPAIDPYAPRSGPFKVLVYSRTVGFRNSYSIANGQRMLAQSAAEYGFELVSTESNEEFTAENLAKYELVFFLSTSGDVLRDIEEQAFETWMVGKNGAFVGIYRAVDTEVNWAFYKELTGEYYDGNSPCCPQMDIEWDARARDFPAVRRLPSPWPFRDLWLTFGDFPAWASQPGFLVLGTIVLDGRPQPVSYVREWNNFRSFCTTLGHQPETFEDENVRQHLTAGILWAVRREHLLD